jgi:hypothetical protein
MVTENVVLAVEAESAPEVMPLPVTVMVYMHNSAQAKTELDRLFFCSFCDVFFLERATLVTADHVRRWKSSCQLKPISERRIAMKVTKTISNEKLASVCGTAKGNCTRTRVPMKVNVTA